MYMPQMGSFSMCPEITFDEEPGEGGGGFDTFPFGERGKR
jgi:hypothetical protein